MIKPSPSKIRAWHRMIAEYVEIYGPVVEGRGRVQFHHVRGRTFRHNKILVGPWFLIPLPSSIHDYHEEGQFNVTNFWKNFVEEYGPQRVLWMNMIDRMKDKGWVLPFGQDVIDAVLDTRY